jgi:hypothetical protein
MPADTGMAFVLVQAARLHAGHGSARSS